MDKYAISLIHTLNTDANGAKTVKGENAMRACCVRSVHLIRIAGTFLLGPPSASLILLAVYYFDYFRTVPFNFADFLVVFFLIAILGGYAFGAVPALLAALLYCALLTGHSWLLRPLIRACGAAICGGLASWVWFGELLSASGIHELVGALVVAALSVGAPRPGANGLMGKKGPPQSGSRFHRRR